MAPAEEEAIGEATAAGEMPPDRMHRVAVEGGDVAVYVYGAGHGETIFAINGGPGVGSAYLRRALIPLAGRGFRVVIHDQLGTGASDRPDDPGLWTLARYVRELEAVRRALRLGPVHLLGHSWGGMLGIEYLLTHPEAVRSAVLSNTSADIPAHIAEVRRLLSAFGGETLAMVDRHEREGSIANPEYQAISTLFSTRHSSHRRRERHDETVRDLNRQIQEALWGPAEFSASGELARWTRLAELRRIAVPCLVLVGAFDYATPRSAALIHAALPDSRMVVFADSGHAAYLDEPEGYYGEIERFLAGVRRAAAANAEK